MTVKPKIWDYGDYYVNSLIVKTTDYCNLRCKYCYMHDKNSQQYKHIDYKLIEKLLVDYFTYAKSNQQQLDLYVVWHGGEPALCSLEFFKKAFEIERQVLYKMQLDKNVKIFNAIQTNGTLLTADKCKFFKEHNVMVGVSVDGIPSHHDLYRVFPNGSGTYSAINKGIKNLHKFHVPFTCICVIHKESIGHEIFYYEHFKNLGAVEVDFIPSFFQGSIFNLSANEYAQFIKNMFDIYVTDKNRSTKVRVIEDIMKAVLSSMGMYAGSIGCEYAGRCGENLSISSNGDVYPCDCLQNIDSLRLGNLFESNLDDILQSCNFEKFKEFVNILPQKCSTCSIFSICKGGCFNRRIISFAMDSNSFSEDFYCSSRKQIIEYIMERCYEKCGNF